VKAPRSKPNNSASSRASGIGGAVDVDEGASAAGVVAVEEAGDEALAGAGVALEEDRGKALARALPIEQAAQLVPDYPDGRALAEQFG